MSLVKNEWIKIFSKVSTYIFIAFLLLAALGTAVIDYKLSPDQSKDWKQEVKADIKEQQKALEATDISDDEKAMIMDDIEVSKHLLADNINPDLNTNWTYMAQWTMSLTSFVTLFVVIVCSSLVSSEFSDGTIKQLLIRPYKRWKILLSKYITSLLFAALLLSSLVIFSYLIGIIFFGNGSYSDKILDPSAFGEFKPVVVGSYFVDMMVYWIPGFLVITTIAFMLSTLFKNQALAVGISIFILFASSPLNMVIQSFIGKYEWLKFVLFPHLDLRVYISGPMEMFDGATLGFSMGVLGIYYLIFLALTFFFFQKKDITN
ncbi:ABC transporter permease [Peribacillus simplex]|uniref:ABC transporter permease n=1 Tax=Peribacillus simplex TaxID=1478 RepID=UPI003D2A82EB